MVLREAIEQWAQEDVGFGEHKGEENRADKTHRGSKRLIKSEGTS